MEAEASEDHNALDGVVATSAADTPGSNAEPVPEEPEDDRGDVAVFVTAEYIAAQSKLYEDTQVRCCAALHPFHTYWSAPRSYGLLTPMGQPLTLVSLKCLCPVPGPILHTVPCRN